MKTVIVSSSMSLASKSYVLAREVEKRLIDKGVNVVFVDLREYDLQLTHKGKTKDQEELTQIMQGCDNVVFAMGVHCYSINDSLKVFLDTCCSGLIQKFYGIVCAAGGQKSYLSTMHLTQICQNEWRMMQLPEVVYALGGDFTEFDGEDGNPFYEVSSEDVIERLDKFSNRFAEIGEKLL